MIRQTSLDSYDGIKADGTLGRQQVIIFDFIKRYSKGLTREEVSQLLSLRLSSVCGRVNELIKKGCVFEQSRRLNTTGREGYILKVAK